MIVTERTSFRHASPELIEGWLLKEGKLFRTKNKRYLRIANGTLSNHKAENEPATWDLDLTECKVREGPRKYEIRLELPKRVVSFFAENEKDYKKWVTAFKRACFRDVEDYYSIGDVLGVGAFGTVRVAFDKESGEKVALKIIKKDSFKAKELEHLQREVEILRSMQHPNIVQTYDIFETKTRIYIILEFMEGGELFNAIATAGHFSESDARDIMKEILHGVGYLHQRGIVHRDLKPENILLKSKDWPLEIKIADFGLANFTIGENGTSVPLTTTIGTIGYIAPEVILRQSYGAPVDLWACGVILYIMLSGKMPFFGKNELECFKRVVRGQYSFPSRYWKDISKGAKDLTRKLLEVDPNKRLTVEQSLNHPWIKAESLSKSNIESDRSGLHSSKRKFLNAVYNYTNQ
ncbi:hypothetical protein GAYE_PCTG52G1268 [Galdieria yellowstonensis]|uniref:Non-specific serine/threonine protein kinase n=1 Tax=Galdieria yellowstonensis TaxID=3028027 RepID=A0AAV9I4H2_9RHOD|nr:hypothetical protein GAYE_PCTG52G1268 [Galdieria yellowstonensis]